MDVPSTRPSKTVEAAVEAPPHAGIPTDPRLPTLRAIALEGPEAVLRRLGLVPPFDGFEVLKAHPGHRCTFALRAAGRPLVAKAFHRAVGSQIELFEALQRHGLATGVGPTAPRLIAVDAELRLLVFERLDGPVGAPLVARGERVGELAAGWLLAQWGAGVTVGREYGASEFLQRVERDALVFADASAEACRDAAAAVLARLACLLPGPSEPVLVHGSFSVNHVLDLGTGAGVVDWDGFRQGPRELDVAAFLATLARVAGKEASLAAPAARAAAAFRAQLEGKIDAAALAWFEAGSLIRNARHLCALRLPDWESRSSLLLARADGLLQAGP